MENYLEAAGDIMQITRQFFDDILVDVIFIDDWPSVAAENAVVGD